MIDAKDDFIEYSTVLFNHDFNRPIGRVIDAEVDDTGLLIKVILSKTEKEIWEKGYLGYNEKGNRILLSKSARIISRYFRGSFVIFAKSSPYNKNHVTYDARHDRMNSKKFRQYIEKCIIKYNEES